ncbi:hypothetical protein, partial [Enterobacter cloacae complex sp. 288G10]|uniref:hypothetical protein n=1 Tax=Enterobacter cloacae complex sp. 288G10 TaxID=3395859 RepID=UPI003CEAA38B
STAVSGSVSRSGNKAGGEDTAYSVTGAVLTTTWWIKWPQRPGGRKEEPGPPEIGSVREEKNYCLICNNHKLLFLFWH